MSKKLQELQKTQLLQAEQPQEVRVAFLPRARQVRLPAGNGVLAAAREAGVPLASPCDGRGLCGACRVRFVDGAPQPGVWDRLHLEPRELEAGFRLACRASLRDPALLSVPRQGAPLTLDGRSYPYRLAPPSQRAHVRASLSDLTPETAAVLPALALEEEPRELTLQVLGAELRAVELGRRSGGRLGVAAAVQGEWLEGWLLDLDMGAQLATARSRLIGATPTDPERAEGVAAASRRLVRTLCLNAARRLDDVSDVVLAGATRAAVADARDRVPRIAGQGRDGLVDAASAAALACVAPGAGASLLLGLEPSPWALLLLDDLALFAAAPCRRPAADLFARAESPGAVQAVSLADDVELGYAGGPPKALTLAGAVDCVAGLRRAGLLDRRGMLAKRTAAPALAARALVARLSEPRERAAFRLWDAPHHPGVALTHEHVRQVQRLKSSLCSARDLVLARAGVSPEELDRLVLVGEDAGSLRVRSALDLGILPDVSPALVHPFTGAVGVGARLALLSHEAGTHIEMLASRCARLPLEGPAPAWADNLYLEPAEPEDSSPLARALA